MRERTGRRGAGQAGQSRREGGRRRESGGGKGGAESAAKGIERGERDGWKIDGWIGEIEMMNGLVLGLSAERGAGGRSGGSQVDKMSVKSNDFHDGLGNQKTKRRT